VIIAVASITVAIILCFGMIMSSIIAKLPIRSATTQHAIEMYADKNWQDTGVEIKQGETITIHYVSGEWSPFSGYYTDGQGCTDPDVCTQDLSVLESTSDNSGSLVVSVKIRR